jgi:alpha 1,2-mannosyltransferase
LGLTDDMKKILQDHSKAPLTFQLISFSIPGHIKEINREWRIGYMHMCRFFANEIFNQPILQDFEYYCRLDTDSYILSPVNSNIFEDAKQSNIKYGYINDSLRDSPPYVVGLWPLAKTFIDNHPNIPIYSKLYSEIEERRLYYTNFELCYIPWFKQETWKMFFDEIDKSGGIYKYRWGDHIIRYIGVRSFMPQEYIKRITNIHYSHQGLEDNRP